MIKCKACPLCEKLSRVAVDSKEFYTELIERTGSIAFSVECKDCNLELTDYVREPIPYEEAYDTLVKRWNALPRWQKVCIKFEGGKENG